MEGVRQGRHHHVGGPADRLSDGRPGLPGVRAAGLPARCGVQLVHVLADAGALPVRARRAAGDVPRGAGAARGPGAGVGGRGRRPGACGPLQARPGQGRPGARVVGRGGRDGGRRAGPHHQAVRAGPCRGVLADPGDVDRVARRRRAVPRAPRRAHAVVLRLVRGPAGRVATGVRRPDGRAGVGRLVGRGLPDHVGLERAGDPHARRALDGRGAVPRAEGRRGQPGLRGQHEVRGRVAGGGARHGRGVGVRDGARRAAGVLRRAGGAVLRGLRAPVHRPAVPRAAGRARRAVRAGQVPHGGGPAGRGGHQRERGVQDGAARRTHGAAGGAGRVARAPVR